MTSQTVIATGTYKPTGIRLCVFAEDYNRSGERVYKVCKEAAPTKFAMFGVPTHEVELDG